MPVMSQISSKVSTVPLLLALLLAGIPCSGQSTPNPEFQETTLIPFFQKKDPKLAHFETFYKKDLDGTHTLLTIRARWNPPESASGDVWVGLFLIKPAEPDWVRPLTFLHSSKRSLGVKVERVDDRSIVLHQTDYDYRFPLKLKLFFNAKSGQLLKQLEYTPLPVGQILELNGELYFLIDGPLDFAVNTGWMRRWQKLEKTTIARLDRGKPIVLDGTAPDLLLARPRKRPMLRAWANFTSPEFREAPREYRPFGDQGLFTAVVNLHSEGHVFEYVEGIAERAGDDYKLHELPKATLEDLIQANPSREGLYRSVQSDWQFAGLEEGSILNEGIGPYQIVGNRFWFGKIFYPDLLGTQGTGGFGYFDPNERRYVLFRPRDMVGYSVSALLVEESDVWLGLTRRGEGYFLFSGLMRCDRDTGQVEQFQFSEDYGSEGFFRHYEVITQIKRWRDSLFLATHHGLLIFRENQLIRYTFEPTIDGEIEVRKINP